MDLHDSNESSIQVVCLRLLRVENVHRMCAAGDGEDGLGGGTGGRGDGRRVTKEGERKGGERGERRKTSSRRRRRMSHNYSPVFRSNGSKVVLAA